MIPGEFLRPLLADYPSRPSILLSLPFPTLHLSMEVQPMCFAKRVLHGSNLPFLYLRVMTRLVIKLYSAVFSDWPAHGMIDVLHRGGHSHLPNALYRLLCWNLHNPCQMTVLKLLNDHTGDEDPHHAQVMPQQWHRGLFQSTWPRRIRAARTRNERATYHLTNSHRYNTFSKQCSLTDHRWLSLENSRSICKIHYYFLSQRGYLQTDAHSWRRLPDLKHLES